MVNVWPTEIVAPALNVFRAENDWARLSSDTFELRRPSATVPVVIFVPLIAVIRDPSPLSDAALTSPSTLKLATAAPFVLNTLSVVSAPSFSSIVVVPDAIRLSVASLITSTLLAESSVRSPAPPEPRVTAPAPVNNGEVTDVEKLTALFVVMLLHVPPDPRVIEFPPPLRLPVPLGQVIVMLPSTAVFADEPYSTASVEPLSVSPFPVRSVKPSPFIANVCPAVIVAPALMF
jgi:hypothetical protein